MRMNQDERKFDFHDLVLFCRGQALEPSGSKIGIAGHNVYLFKTDSIIQHGQVPQALSPRVHQMSDR